MTAARIDIERALDELISNEEGMRFQGLAVILAKQKWPDLVASERKKDLGLDAYASAALAADGIGKGLACSLTSTLAKIKSDATKVKKHFEDIRILIFATAEKVTNETKEKWLTEIRKDFGYTLIVMSREDIIASLLLPSNAPVCRSHLHIAVAIEESAVELVERVRDATADVIAGWLAHPRLAGKPLIALRAIKHEEVAADTGHVVGLEDIQEFLTAGRRIVLEAPAGRGKTTTIVQLARQCAGGLPFLIDLPVWTKSGLDMLDFIARMPPFRSRNIDAAGLAKLYQVERCAFLLDGWNEISESHIAEAVLALRDLERSFPAAGIIVATRAHHISPPLPGAFRVKLLPLTRAQRADYLTQSLGSRSNELRVKLDNIPALDDLTRTPLILSEVTTIFNSGTEIPTTKMGVLHAVMSLLEQSEEHESFLRAAPLAGHAQDYLAGLAVRMTTRGDTTIAEEEARPIANEVSARLQAAGQITTLPEPASILNALCAHHILERLDSPGRVFRFEHQQFQELYAALLLSHQLQQVIQQDSEDRNREFARRYVNEPAWEEPLRMVAEEIGMRSVEVPGDTEMLRAGKRLVEITLTVDPILAAELSRLCGRVVWREIGNAVSERLRSWYGFADENHRRCALAGMLASGSHDFADIILPLLTSSDQQVRLSTYRRGIGFHFSSLGPEWTNVVRGWNEEARIEFIHAVSRDKWTPEIVDHFAMGDPSARVRAAAVQALSWVGSSDDIAGLLETVDREAFEIAAQEMALELIPPPLHPRALAVYQKLLAESTDPLSRLRLLLKAAELGQVGVVDKLKQELASLPIGSIGDAREYVVRPAINIVRKSDPDWASHWVASRIVGGQLWREGWSGVITTIPEAMKDQLLEKLGAEDLQHSRTPEIIAVLAAIADASLAKTVFERLCAVRTSLSGFRGPGDQVKWAIARQLEDLFRAFSPDIAVAAIEPCFGKGFDAVESTTVLQVFSTVARDVFDLRGQLREDLRQKLRAYLKNGVTFALSQDDFTGELKADLASALARVGQPEDMPDLVRLVAADIERVRRGRAARARGERGPIADGAPMSYADWNVRAVASLDSAGAETVFLNLLSEPEYEGEAGLGLVRLARDRTTEERFSYRQTNYRIVWEARAGQRPMGFDEARRERYAAALNQRLATLLEERAHSAQPAAYNYRLNRLAGLLAVLDSRRSVQVVLEILALPGEGWGQVETLETLLFNGINLPTEGTPSILNPIMARVGPRLYYDAQSSWLLKQCLCLLPFVDVPSVGIDRIRQVIAEARLPVHELRDVVTALGGSRCPEAVALLRELAGNDGAGLRHLGEEWINAVAELGGPEAKRILLSFVDPDLHEFATEVNLDYHEYECLATRIADVARQDNGVMQRLLRLCNMQLSALKRSLLSKVISKLGTAEMVCAGLSLLEDGATPPVPYDLHHAIENVCLEHRPYPNTENVYTLVPRSANAIRARLFELALSDTRRKQSALSLLGEIEVLRVEHGRPGSEHRHPAFDTGQPWPPILTSLRA